jgi:azurin
MATSVAQTAEYQTVPVKESPMIRRHSVLAALAIAAVSLAGGTHAAFAADKVCKLEIAGNDAMQYDKKELDVAGDCTQVELTLTHTGKLPAAAMGHNWVLVKTADVTTVANAGMSAGLANNYLTPGDTHVIASTKVIGGGQSTSVTFPTSKLSKGGDYTFMCTFPGHYVIMKGSFKFG